MSTYYSYTSSILELLKSYFLKNWLMPHLEAMFMLDLGHLDSKPKLLNIMLPINTNCTL
jgi:hypothetical protein